MEGVDLGGFLYIDVCVCVCVYVCVCMGVCVCNTNNNSLCQDVLVLRLCLQ